MVQTARLRRGFCICFAAFFLVSVPVRSYGASLVVAAAGTYATKTLLAACGVAAGTAMITALLGSWDDEDTYAVLGAAKKLGSFAQKIYDGARDSANERMEYYQQLEETLLALVTSAWGDAVSGVSALAAELKDFLSYCYGYGSSGTTWAIPTVQANNVWGETEWSTLNFCPLPTTPTYMVPYMASSSDWTLFLTLYTKTSYTGVMEVLNLYYYNTKDIFGVYNPVTHVMTTYQRNAEEKSYSDYYVSVYYAYLYSTGKLYYSIQSTNFWETRTFDCDPEDAGLLSFPVFSSLADAEVYVSTGSTENAYINGTVPVEVDTFREEVATGTIADVLTFPASAEEAAEKLGVLENIYADAGVADLEDALTDTGLTVTITDVPAVPDDTDDDEVIAGGEASILDAVTALPGEIADAIADLFTIDAEEAEEQLSLPAIICSKFPFCIPFDFIHLVQVLSAEKEVPRFEIPIKFDYAFLHYDETFVVDMSEFDSAIAIFRIMLDLLFCSSLIFATRGLIRG